MTKTHFVRAIALAREAGLHKQQVYAAIDRGELPYLDLAGPNSQRSAYYIPRPAADAWLAGLTQQAQANADQAREKLRRYRRPRNLA